MFSYWQRCCASNAEIWGPRSNYVMTSSNFHNYEAEVAEDQSHQTALRLLCWRLQDVAQELQTPLYDRSANDNQCSNNYALCSVVWRLSCSFFHSVGGACSSITHPMPTKRPLLSRSLNWWCKCFSFCFPILFWGPSLFSFSFLWIWRFRFLFELWQNPSSLFCVRATTRFCWIKFVDKKHSNSLLNYVPPRVIIGNISQLSRIKKY